MTDAKVIKVGSLSFGPDGLFLDGWDLDCGGGTTEDGVLAAIDHIRAEVSLSFKNGDVFFDGVRHD